ncbi:MAG TPA: hypothetical protein VIL16_21625 [Trebonia sp.]
MALASPQTRFPLAPREAAGPGGFTVRVLKPTEDTTPVTEDISRLAKWSGGEKLTVCVALYCTIVALRGARTGRGTRPGGFCCWTTRSAEPRRRTSCGCSGTSRPRTRSSSSTRRGSRTRPPSALEAAGRIASRPDEHALLERVAGWLRDNLAPVRVPAEERSAELFDDEKALDRYRKTRLFTSGALTLDLLACYDPPLPFVSQHVPGSGPVTLLVAENLATYTSFLTAVRALDEATRPHLHVAWGIGGSFEQSVLSIPLLDPQPRHVRYFRDLDRAGLRIAASAARQAARAASRRCFPRPGATSSC